MSGKLMMSQDLLDRLPDAPTDNSGGRHEFFYLIEGVQEAFYCRIKSVVAGSSDLGLFLLVDEAVATRLVVNFWSIDKDACRFHLPRGGNIIPAEAVLSTAAFEKLTGGEVVLSLSFKLSN